MHDFEEWEVDDWLLENKDYKGYLDYKSKAYLKDSESVYYH